MDILVMDRGYWRAEYLTKLKKDFGIDYVTRVRDEGLEACLVEVVEYYGNRLCRNLNFCKKIQLLILLRPFTTFDLSELTDYFLTSDKGFVIMIAKWVKRRNR